YENAMCWFSLAGTALTLGVAIAIFIHYKADVLGPDEANTDEAVRRQGMSLDGRVADADLRAAEGKPARSDNWLSRIAWIRRFRTQYYLGIDGISLPLVLLTAFLSFLAMIPSFHIKRYDSKERFVKGYCALFLLLETGMLGTFVALDFFLFYIFWEVMLLPM